MSLISGDILSKPSILLMKHIGQSITEPTAITMDVSTGGASVGDTTVTVDAESGITIPKNAFLEAPSELLVNRVAVDIGSGGDLTVGLYGGEASKGIQTALSAAEVITWRNLYTLVGMQSHPFAKNANINSIRAADYHGNGTDVGHDKYEVSSLAPNIQVNVIREMGSQIDQDLENYSDSNDHFWARQIIINGDTGAIVGHRANYGKVRGWSEGRTNDGREAATFTFQFFGNSEMTWA